MENIKEIRYLIDNQELMTEWDWDKNNVLNLDPKELKPKSNKKVWWRCKFGHSWASTIAHRSEGQRCPYCYGNKIIVGETDLKTTNPELALEWHPNKNKLLTPMDVSCGSDKKVWWMCKIGHEWEATIGSRARGCGCPYCSGNKVLSGFNDLATINPQLAFEWNYTKNEDLLPSQVAAKCNKNVWWICEQGHEWKATPNNRSAGKGCPICAKEMKTSFPEQAILFYCKKVTVAENRNTDFGKEIDIYLPEYKIGIEYNGIYYHNNKKDKDKEKIEYFKNKNIRIISVNEGDKNSIIGDNIEYIYKQINKGALDWAINEIFKMLNVDYKPIDVHEHQIEIWNQYIISKKENSLMNKFPEIANEWHPTKNGNLKPENFVAGSNKNVWWQCNTCGHEWKTSVVHRSRDGSNCPKCAAKNHNKKNCKPVYCVEWNTVFNSKSYAERKIKINIGANINGKTKTAGKDSITHQPLHWKYVFDNITKNGDVIYGAITLGYITLDEVNKQLTI